MFLQVRCFTCGKVINNKLEPYNKLVNDGMSTKESLTKLGLTRYCCRESIMTHVDVSDKVLEHDKWGQIRYEKLTK